MNQIRQKKKTFRNQIRREFLQNHFRTLRSRFTIPRQIENNGLGQNESNEMRILLQYMDLSLIKNRLAEELRQNNLIQFLSQAIRLSCQRQDNQMKRYILAIISNMFYDQLTIYELEALFKLSIELFVSLDISKVDFSYKQQKQKFNTIINVFRVDTLFFYLSTIFQNSTKMQEVDQQIVEIHLFPAFLNLTFYVIHNKQSIRSIITFQRDFVVCVRNIFDPNEQLHQTFNKQKAKRNLNFLLEIVISHSNTLNQLNKFPESIDFIEKHLFWLYNKLEVYYTEVRQIFQSKYLLLLIEHKFYQFVREDINDKNMKGVFSTMRIFIDKDLFINELSQMIGSELENFEGIRTGFDKLLQMISKKVDLCYSIELLEGLTISYFYNNNFVVLFQKHKYKIAEICVQFLYGVQMHSLSGGQDSRFNIGILRKILSIVYSINQKENQKILSQINQFITCFQSLGGMQRLAEIHHWFQQLDHYEEDQNIPQISAFIQAISMENLEIQYHQKQNTQ